MTIVIIIIIVLFLIFVISKSGPVENKSTKEEIDVPHPENSEPKVLIDFIDSNFAYKLKEIYKQIESYNINEFVREAFIEKINNSYISKEKYYDLLQIKYKKIAYREPVARKTKGDIAYDIIISGVSFNNRLDYILENCSVGDQVILKAEPSNKSDSNAIAIYHLRKKIGYVSKTQTKKFINRLNFCNSKISMINYTDNFLFLRVNVIINVP